MHYPIYRLIWEYDGALRHREFADWKKLVAFSNRLIAAGLTPKVI